MLQQLLRLVGAGGLQTVPALAQTLALPEALVRQMLAQLEQQGYLRAVMACAESCAGCAVAAGCQLFSAARVWTLTERGQRALAAEKGL